MQKGSTYQWEKTEDVRGHNELYIKKNYIYWWISITSIQNAHRQRAQFPYFECALVIWRLHNIP